MHAFITFSQLSSAESSSSSDHNNSGSNAEAGGSGCSELDLKLASQNPKKRAGRKRFKETRHPVYRGVRSRDAGKWVCEIREPVTQSRVWLGSYPTPEMAARAHDVAVLAMRGPSACLNFADSVWRLPVPESNNVSDIQKAAREAAEAFRHTEEVVVAEETKVVLEMESSSCYVDEEEIYGAPEFYNSMAEALMVPPPQTMDSGDFLEEKDFCADVSLWNF